MKKREIIYLHGLLGEVQRHIERRESLPPQDFEAYREYGVGPTAIHRTKGEHEEAVRLLLDALVGGLDDERHEESTEEASVRSR